MHVWGTQYGQQLPVIYIVYYNNIFKNSKDEFRKMINGAKTFNICANIVKNNNVAFKIVVKLLGEMF